MWQHIMRSLTYFRLQVTCAVLQLINQIIKDNSGFQENACLIGFVSIMFIQVFAFCSGVIATNSQLWVYLA